MCILRRLSGPVAWSLAVSMSWCLPASASSLTPSGQLRALVVGIDDYDVLNDLKGAVNDANLLTAALTAAGAREVVTLTNGQATRVAIFDRLDTLAAASSPGDTLLLTYAGHGGQQPERVRGSESDGFDEVLQLAAYRDDPHNDAHIVDDDLHDWIARHPDLRIMLVLDSCHSGTMTRKKPKIGAELSVRFGMRGTQPSAVFAPIVLDAPAVDEGVQSHEIRITAIDDAYAIPELRLDGQYHGALSYYMAKAIGGGADQNADGVTTLGELRLYLNSNAKNVAESQVRPSVDAQLDKDAPIFGTVNRGSIDNDTDGWPPLPVAGLSDEVLSHLNGVEPSPSVFATLVFRFEDGRWNVYSTLGDHIVSFEPAAGGAIPVTGAQAVIEKWRSLARLHRLAEPRPLAVNAKDGSGTYHQGLLFEPEFVAPMPKWVLMLTLASDGTIQAPNEPIAGAKLLERRISAPVVPPFGADHFVVIGSDRPLHTFAQAVAEINMTSESMMLIDLLANMIDDDSTVRIGIVPLYTALQQNASGDQVETKSMDDAPEYGSRCRLRRCPG